MTATDRDDDKIFEDEVRSIARHLWPAAEYGGATMVGEREMDGLFETEDCIHLVEATTSGREDKAKKDIGKMVNHASRLKRSGRAKAVLCWFVTKSEPSAVQRRVANQYPGLVNAVSYRQFKAKLIDVVSYLRDRSNYRFGSVRDPGTGAAEPRAKYVPLACLDAASGETWDFSRMVDQLDQGGRIVLLGDYGAGKSMTLREIYFGLRRRHLKGDTYRFPIYINLRDHYGQDDPTEVLERHAKIIGFSQPTHLVRAWRAGYGIVILDGFDEVASLAIQGPWKRLRENRFRSMEVVRRFVRDTPSSVGVALAGRAYFFDNERERRSALGTHGFFVDLTLNDFTEDQIREYVKSSGYAGTIPCWMPARPLLVGYLVSRGALPRQPAESGRENAPLDPAIGWHDLIGRICDREAEIEAGIDGQTIRRVLERTASKARGTLNGLGPVASEQVQEAFEEICGYKPDEQAMVILQRLPGLGVGPDGGDNRSFIDEDFADTCRAGDLVYFCEQPFGSETGLLEEAECALGALGVEVAALALSRIPGAEGKLGAAIQRTNQLGAADMLRADLVRIVAAMGISLPCALQIQGILIPDLEISGSAGDISRARFTDCYFMRLDVDPQVEGSRVPKFSACFIAEMDGRVSRDDLPAGAFDSECVFDAFRESVETTSSILDLGLPLGLRVLLTVLKKLYVQRGKGRKENALFRGLDQRSRQLVPDALRLLQSHGLATQYRRGGLHIWLPDRSQMARTGRLLVSPSTCGDPVIKEASAL
ncbi:MAG TPA: NACHT domain-containing protein [Planctomycetota bacterium]|nr:NACHT domain-containing protein [Planctomycetota bacterium]